MAAGDSIADAEEEENEVESKRTTTPGTLRRYFFIDGINLSPPPSNTWSLVSIKDSHEGADDSSFLVFPPTHHENLHLSPPSPPHPHPVLDLKHHGRSLTTPFLSSSSSCSEIVDDEDESNDDSSTSTLFSPSPGPDSPLVPTGRKMVGVARWVNLGMEVVFSKVKGLLLLYGPHRIPAKKSAFTAAAMVVGFLYFYWRRRGRIERESRDRVVRIIKEKDERINQLLNQIARMNDLLLALQRLRAPSKKT